MHGNTVLVVLVLLLLIGGVVIIPRPERPGEALQQEARSVTVYQVEASTGNWQWHRKGLLPGSWFGALGSAAELANLLSTRPFLQGRIPLDVDWTRELLVIAALGEAPTGGHAVRILRVSCDGRVANVVTHLRSPAPADYVTQVITYPVDVVHVGRDLIPGAAAIEWRFVDQRGTRLASVPALH